MVWVIDIYVDIFFAWDFLIVPSFMPRRELRESHDKHICLGEPVINIETMPQCG